MPTSQHAKSSTNEIVNKQVVMFIIYTLTSLCINELKFLQFSVKLPGLMRLLADDLAYNLVLLFKYNLLNCCL